jgi:hypothetical protein
MALQTVQFHAGDTKERPIYELYMVWILFKNRIEPKCAFLTPFYTNYV